MCTGLQQSQCLRPFGIVLVLTNYWMLTQPMHIHCTATSQPTPLIGTHCYLQDEMETATIGSMLKGGQGCQFKPSQPRLNWRLEALGPSGTDLRLPATVVASLSRPLSHPLVLPGPCWACQGPSRVTQPCPPAGFTESNVSNLTWDSSMPSEFEFTMS